MKPACPPWVGGASAPRTLFLRSVAVTAATLLAAAPSLASRPARAGEVKTEKAAAAKTAAPAAEMEPEPPKSQEELVKEKNAEIHFNRGVDFFQDGMISAALAEFLKCYKEIPQWAVLYNVGVCLYRLGRYEDALKALDRYIEEGGDGIPPERRFAVEKMKIKMAASYGSLVVDYKLPGVRVTIDGKSTYETPLEKPIPISAGLHTVFLFREGHYPQFLEISVASGEETVVPVKMQLMPLMEAWMTDTGKIQVPGQREKTRKLDIAVWSLIGASAALGITTLVAGAMTYKIKEDQDGEIIACAGLTSREDCPKAYDLGEKGTSWKWATNGLAAATGALFVAAVTVWIVKKLRLRKIQADVSGEVSDTRTFTFQAAWPGALRVAW
jgi:hypothetical protein